MRDTSRDGWQNRLETHVLTNFEPMWSLLQRVEPLRRLTNRTLISRRDPEDPDAAEPVQHDGAVLVVGVADRPPLRQPPPPADGAGRAARPRRSVADLFMRRGAGVQCEKSTVMFAYFAQWFTDGFLRSDRSPQRDPRRNDTNHELDLTPLYGPHKPITERCARTRAGG